MGILADPRVLVILAVLAAGYYVGEKAVAGIKKVDRAAVHAVQKAGRAVKHVFVHETAKDAQP